jgi:uncharacterized membrane protein YfcA
VAFDLATSASAGLIVFCAYLVRGIAGFGSGLIAVPLLALMFPVQTVVPIVVLLDYLGSASQGVRNRKHVAWREQLPLVPFTLVGVGCGLALMKAMTSATLAQTLGAFVILYAAYQLLPLRPFRGSRIFVAPCGFLGGLVGTLFGTGGPFYIIYLSLRQLEKSVLRATFAANFLIDGGIRLAAYGAFGVFGREGLFAFLGALPIAAAGLWLGGRIHATISAQTFTRLISALLLISGFALILKN